MSETLKQKLEQLAEAVNRMRALQVRCQQYRVGTDLQAKKRWEQKVDGLLKEIVKEQASNQQDLFKG